MTSHDPDRVPLLGRLVAVLADRHEVAATFAVTVLLEDDSVARPFTTWLANQAGVGLPEQLTYRCELALDGGRVDVAGEDGDTVRVACEAKFGALLESGQLADYAGAAPEALVVVLVPENRRDEAQRALDPVVADRSRSGVVLTWEQVCDALVDAGADACDVAQLRALCRAAASVDVAALREGDLGAGRDHRLDDLDRIAEQVTQQLHDLLGARRVNPTGRWGGGFIGKYRFVEPTGSRGVTFAVGVRAHEQAPDTPFWMRWHRDTGRDAGVVDAIEERLRQHNQTATREEDHGHLWMPLHPPLGVGGQEIVRQLVDQARKLHEITRPAIGC